MIQMYDSAYDLFYFFLLEKRTFHSGHFILYQHSCKAVKSFMFKTKLCSIFLISISLSGSSFGLCALIWKAFTCDITGQGGKERIKSELLDAIKRRITFSLSNSKKSAKI